MMDQEKYYFKRSSHDLEIGNYFDDLDEDELAVLRQLARELDYEEIAYKFDLDEEVVEQIGENLLQKLIPVAHLMSSKPLKDTGVVTAEVKNLIIEAFNYEMDFRKERGEYIRRKGLSHVPV
jgi:hypothetical protein